MTEIDKIRARLLEASMWLAAGEPREKVGRALLDAIEGLDELEVVPARPSEGSGG